MTQSDRERLVATLQVATNAVVELLGLPKRAWGDLTIRIEDGRVVLPAEVRLTFK